MFWQTIAFSSIFSLFIQNIHLKCHRPHDGNYLNYELCTTTSTSGVCLPLLRFSSINKNSFKPKRHTERGEERIKYYNPLTLWTVKTQHHN